MKNRPTPYITAKVIEKSKKHRQQYKINISLTRPVLQHSFLSFKPKMAELQYSIPPVRIMVWKCDMDEGCGLISCKIS